ncbi:DUF5683 domain-containing protein [Bacteroidota bacterium]
MPKTTKNIISGISVVFFTFQICFFACSQTSYLQQNITDVIPAKDTSLIRADNMKSPKGVLLRSAAIPGWGQIANGQYWKLPIVYAGLGACVYMISINNGWYKDFKEAYILRTDDNDNTIDQFDPDFGWSDYRFGLSSQLQNLRDSYRRNLELSVIAFSGVYLLNILDAYISAHLRDFDMSEDLSIRIHSPSLLSTNGQAEIVYGLTITF